MRLKHEIQLPVFEGPLDLLLHLIEREELDVTTVALAQVTDQYMAYLAQLEERQVRELADFLVVAAKLLLIKSNALLPRPPALPSEAEDDVGDDLVRQLRAYKRFKEIAALLNERQHQGLHSYVRIAPLPRLNPQPDLGDVSLDDLLRLVQQALGAIPAAPADDVVAPITITIDEQIVRIERRLVLRRRVAFRDILTAAQTRMEVIVTLMAVLELVKRDQVLMRQEKLFGDIVIERLDDANYDANQDVNQDGVGMMQTNDAATSHSAP